MGLGQPHAQGRQMRVYARRESTFGTFLKPAATNALEVLRCDMTYAQERKDRMDRRGTRSVQSRFSGKKTCTWEIETYLVPSGSATEPPDIHDLLAAAMSLTGYTDGGASQTYALVFAEGIAAMPSLSIVRHFGNGTAAVTGDAQSNGNGFLGVAMQALKGAWVESMTISVSGGSEPRITFSGGAKDMINTSISTANGAINSATATTVTIDEQSAMEPGSVFAVVGGGGDYVTDVEITAGGLTTAAKTIASTDLSIASGTNVADAATIYPFVPTPTLESARTVESGISGSFVFTAATNILGPNGDATLNSATDKFYFTEFELTVNQAPKPHDDEALVDSVNDVTYGWREVTGSLTFRARQDLCVLLGFGKAFQATDLQVVIGTTAGQILTINLDQVEFDTSELEVPEAEEAMITLPFKALGDATGEDEVTLVFT